ncbi:MAG: type II secretion system F family protein [Actinomycetota bacterium]|nr:type II secretion system F family protein [Actinomycetota bacterium]
MLILFGIACLAGAAYLVADVATLPARERELSVRRAATYGRLRFLRRDDSEPFGERVLVPLKNRLAALVLKLNPKTSIDAIERKLLAAGMSRKVSPNGFLAVKAGAGIAAALLGFLFGAAAAGIFGVLLFGAGFGALGFFAPDFALSARARKRKDEIRAQLPDALDLLAVSVEAGLGFDGAISKLTEHMEGPLAEEFALTLNEVRIGEARQDALKKLSERADTPELSGFVRAVIQADQLGISLGRILRVQATDTRLRRQAAAEERAMKAPIKMLFPTVLFIFPAMFLVILGPAFLNLGKFF